ncbi:DnaJ heat shock protein family (Hsp40) member C1 [Willisornis vidua]|uniref:DnaJ heat shock protein family (Hsp40) member C1 n=1 Tax=Willisornis vidua TaxID=1566151 RepID=A0ABQ9CTX3_9PASS|nr:DnaJ heat shock protein family (Hsp40) member C1 [Willisornis vidua]
MARPRPTPRPRLLPLLALLALLAPRARAWDSGDLELFDLVEEVPRNFYDFLGVQQLVMYRSGVQLFVIIFYNPFSLGLNLYLVLLNHLPYFVTKPSPDNVLDEFSFWATVFLLESQALAGQEWRQFMDQHELLPFFLDAKDASKYWKRRADASSADIRKAYRKLSLVLHPDKNKDENAETQFRQLVAIYEVLKDEERRQRYDDILINGLPDWRQPVFYYRRVRKMSNAELALLLFIILTVGHYAVVWSIYLEKQLDARQLYVEYKETKMKAKEDALAKAELETLQKEKKPKVKKPKLEFPVYMALESSAYTPSYDHGASIEEIEEQMDDWLGGRNRTQKKKAPEWTEEDLSQLTRSMVKFPGGTPGRWEKIAHELGRSVADVTMKAKQLKDSVTYTPGVIRLSELKTLAQPKNVKVNMNLPDHIITQREREEDEEEEGNYDAVREQMDAQTDPNETISSETRHRKRRIVKAPEMAVLAPEEKGRGRRQRDFDNTEQEEESDDESRRREKSRAPEELWTQNQQKLLEMALQQYPKGTSDRWDKIAKCVPGKSKKKGWKEDLGIRPVSLTSVPGKVTEQITLSAITQHMQDNQGIRPSQPGFENGRSCLSNLIFCDRVTCLMDEGKAVDVSTWA